MVNTIINATAANFSTMAANAPAEKVVRGDFFAEYGKIVFVGKFVCARETTALKRMSKAVGFDVECLRFSTVGINGTFYQIEKTEYNGKCAYTVYVACKICRYALEWRDNTAIFLGNAPVFETLEKAVECIDSDSNGDFLQYVYLGFKTENGATLYIDDMPVGDMRAFLTTDSAPENETTAPANDDSAAPVIDSDSAAISTNQRAAIIAAIRTAAIAENAPADFVPVLTYSPELTGKCENGGAVYTVNYRGIVLTVHDNIYTAKFKNGRTITAFPEYTDSGDIFTTDYTPADIDSGTTYDSARAHSDSAPVNYDSDKQTLRIDRKATRENGHRTYKVAPDLAANVARTFGKTAGANGDYEKPAPAPYSDSEKALFARIAAKFSEMSPAEKRAFYHTEWKYTARLFPNIPFIEIAGTVETGKKTVNKTYHIINDFSAFGMLFNAVIIARLTNRLKLDKMGANGGGTIVKQLIYRDKKLSAAFGKMCAFYGHNATDSDGAPIMQKLIINGKTVEKPIFIDDIAHRTPAEINNFITEIFAFISDMPAHYGQTDSDSAPAVDDNGNTKTATDSKSGADSDKECADIVDIALMTLYENGAPITAQSRYNAARAVNSYLTKSVKEWQNRTPDSAADDNGEYIPFSIADIGIYREYLRAEYGEIMTNDNYSVVSAVGTMAEINYFKNPLSIICQMETIKEKATATDSDSDSNDSAAIIADNFAEWYDNLPDNLREFCENLLECNGEMRGENCGRGDKCGIRTIADKMGISYKVARRYEREIKDSFNKSFKLRAAYIYKHNFDIQTAPARAYFAEMRDSGKKCIIDYTTYTAPTAPTVPEMIEYNGGEIDGLYMYIARKYAIMRNYRDMMTDFKRA